MPLVLPIAAGLSMQRNEAESTEREQRGRGGVASIGVRSSERALLHELFLRKGRMQVLSLRTASIEGSRGIKPDGSESGYSWGLRCRRKKRWASTRKARTNWRKRTSILWVGVERKHYDRDRRARNAAGSGEKAEEAR